MAKFSIFETDVRLNLAYDNFSFDTFVSSTSTLYIYESVEGRTISLKGTGFVVNGANELIAGTVDKVYFGPDGGGRNSISARVDDVNARATDLMNYDGATMEAGIQFMDTLLEGETRVRGVDGAKVSMALTTQELNDDSYTGGPDVVRGNFSEDSYFYGDTEDLNGSGSLRGGDLDFRGTTTSIRGDGDDLSAVSMLIGGDDRIVLLDPTTSDYDNLGTYVYGDVDGVSGNAAVIGGDDFIDVRLVDYANGSTNLYGDARTISATSNVFGGDDIIYGSRTLANNIYGDARTIDTGGGFIAGNDLIYAVHLATVFMAMNKA